MINEALPPGLRDHGRTLDKKGIAKMLKDVAEKHPDQYVDVSKALSDVGLAVSYTSGGASFGLRHMRRSKVAAAAYTRLSRKLQRIMSNARYSDKQRGDAIISAVSEANEPLMQKIFQEAKASKNPLAAQVASGSRGNPMNLRSLLAGDGLYVDGQENVIPIPILRSYSQGLSPAEYWAGAYGARKGLTDLKIATADAGYFAKQMNQATHRLLVSALDDDKYKESSLRGFPADISDPDNEGALLAVGVGGYKRNTILTHKILKDLRRQRVKRILVRSPLVGGPADGGVYARDVGVRERGGLAPIGDYVGMAAAQALTEPLTQAQIGSKHTGGVAGAGAAVSGFKYINQLAQVPKRFKSGAAHAQVDGKVRQIEAAPQGGFFVVIDNDKHYVDPDFDLTVKVGDSVEAGDVLSEGIPNPAEIVKHKGIGEGRKYFVEAFRDAYAGSRLPAHRRNVELVARGLINHVRVNEEMGSYIPGDVAPYSAIERDYLPRAGSHSADIRQSRGKYLERPVLHYTIGTRLRPSVIKTLQQYGVSSVHVHDEPPPFEPEMIRAASSITHDPDWMTRMLGSGQKRSLLTSVHRGGTSDLRGTSFVPSLAAGGESFGRAGKSKGWKTL